MKASPQQEAAVEFVRQRRGNAILEAVAGAGKTTTLMMMVKALRPTDSVALCAFNKAIATEMQNRLVKMGVDTRKVRAGTFHSFGFSAWRRVAPNVKVDDKKLVNLAASLELPEELTQFAVKAVSLAKQRAIGVLCKLDDAVAWNDLVAHFELEDQLADDECWSPTEVDSLLTRGIQASIALLRASIEADREVIDFDDMIYAPLIHDARVWQNDVVFVDEAQDTNPARRALAKKMLRKGGLFIAVGDPHQAIYGFTGADNDALDILAREFNCQRLPLTVTYRCGKRIVAHAREIVSHIEAHESNAEGSVVSLGQVEFNRLGADKLGAEDAILCRNTKPLVQQAFRLIRAGVPCHVEGRDIGRGLSALARKWKVRNLEALVARLDKYLAREVERFKAKGQEQKAEALEDRVETLKVIIEALPGGTVADLHQRIATLFDDTQDGQRARTLTLSTVHKAKGREWDRVYLYGRNQYMPSKWARQDWQVAQEDNLIYVAITRAKQELIEVVVVA